jgi:8-oxo-dGTP pyrophosphatase MutT (NUDIX family)
MPIDELGSFGYQAADCFGVPDLQTLSGQSPIRIAAAVIVDDEGRTLLVRKRGTAAFMQAGGKVAMGETPAEALRREIREELSCGVAGTPMPLGSFRAPAANEPGRVVDAELFAVGLEGEISPGAEIEDAIWHDPADLDSVMLAPLTRDYVLPLIPSLRRSA